MGIAGEYSLGVFRNIFFISIISCLVAIGSPAIGSTTKLGAKCSRVGEVATLKVGKINKKLICKKNGLGKLTWQEVPTTPQKRVAEPSVEQAKVLPNYIGLLETNLSDVDQVAHALTLQKYSETNVIRTKNFFGPNVNSANGKNYLFSLGFAAKLFGRYWDPNKEITIALASFKDFEWMRNYWVTFKDSEVHIELMTNQWKQIGAFCNQGGALFNTEPFFWGCLAPGDVDINDIGIMKFGPHEFFHLVQTDFSRRNGGEISDMPTFFTEGAAEFFGISAAIGKTRAPLGWMQKWRNGWAGGLPNSVLKSFDAAKWKVLINDFSGDYPELVGHNYYSGAYAVQRLVGAKGMDVYFKFMADSAWTHDWKGAFQENYSMSFDEFSTLIANELVQKTKLLQ